MISLRKRGGKYHADLNSDSARVRGPLGTRSFDVARKTVHRIETALAEGKDSPLWGELQRQLPCTTFRRFTQHAGVTPVQLPTWSALRAAFSLFTAQRIKLGKFSPNTSERYEVTFKGI